MSTIAWVADANRGRGQVVTWKLSRDQQRRRPRRSGEAVAWRGPGR